MLAMYCSGKKIILKVVSTELISGTGIIELEKMPSKIPDILTTV